MSNGLIAVVSSPSLEKWDFRSPEKGIGGSETSHVKMAQGLFQAGYNVRSFSPVPFNGRRKDPTGLTWFDNCEYISREYAVVINYRDPVVFDAEKPAGAKWWFVAQDVDYPQWTPERLAKVDRYICLCPVHASYTRQKYPDLHSSGRLFISSNGIDSAAIKKATAGIPRNPKRLMYASSPDRGLMLLLEQWFRIKERVPEAELHVFYGFHNMEKIVSMVGPGDWRAEYQKKLESLLKQSGVVWHDRVGQKELWREWAASNVWPYYCDFPETSPLHGDTMIETLSGPVPIRNLVGTERLVYSCDSQGALSISTARDIRCTRRNAETITLHYKSGRGRLAQKVKTLRLTPDHEVMLRDGTYIPAGDLKPGDSVKAFHRRKNEWGDGYDTIGLTDEQVQPEHRFVFEKLNRKLRINEIVDHVDCDKRNNEPGNLEAKTQAEHAAEHYLRATPEYRQTRRTAFTKMVNSASPAEKSKAALKAWETRRKLSNHKIVKIEKSEPADVYCMDVYPDHNFVANGIVVHNCISSMEAQACGAIPVTTNFWALKQNVLDGYKFDGLPQKSAVVRQLMVERTISLLTDSGDWDDLPPDYNDAGLGYDVTSRRSDMQRTAEETFDWSNVVEQWGRWLEEDLGDGKEKVSVSGSSLVLPVVGGDDETLAGRRNGVAGCYRGCLPISTGDLGDDYSQTPFAPVPEFDEDL